MILHEVQYLCVSACVLVLLAMPACHPDLPITRSIKPLIPKNTRVQRHDTGKKKKGKKNTLPRKKWLNLLCPVPQSLSYTPVQPATVHEHGNVFYLHNHTGRGLTGTLNSGKLATFTVLWLCKKKMNTLPQWHSRVQNALYKAHFSLTGIIFMIYWYRCLAHVTVGGTKMKNSGWKWVENDLII